MDKERYSRVSVYLSREQKERLDEFKDEVEISKVCQKALQDRIDTLSRIRDGRSKSQIHEVINRLRREKKEVEQIDMNMGIKLGYEDGLSASYPDIEAAVAAAEQYEKRRDYYQEQLRTNPFDEFVRHEDIWQAWASRPIEVTNWAAYVDGWFNGLLQFWKSVVDSLNEPYPDDGEPCESYHPDSAGRCGVCPYNSEECASYPTPGTEVSHDKSNKEGGK